MLKRSITKYNTSHSLGGVTLSFCGGIPHEHLQTGTYHSFPIGEHYNVLLPTFYPTIFFKRSQHMTLRHQAV